MGTGASIAAKKLDKTQLMAVLGEFFDEAQYDEHKDSEGCIAVNSLLAVALSMEGLRISLKSAQILIGEDNIHQDIFGVLQDSGGFITVKQLVAAAKGELLLDAGSVLPATTGPVSDDEARRAVNLDGDFLQYCSDEQKSDMGLALAAVTNVGAALKHCSPALQDNVTLVKLAIKSDGSNITFASPRLQRDSSVVDLALKGLPSFSMKWEAVQLAAKMYAVDHQALKEAPLSLRGDNDVIKVVVQTDGLGLKHAMPMVRHERAVVELACQQNMQAVFYASPVALVTKGEPDYKTAPIDPAMVPFLDALWEAQKLAESGKWCPDADSVEKSIKRFPELAKYSPPTDWLATCAERAAKEKAAAEARKEAILKARDEEEKKDALWSAGLGVPAASELKKEESKEEGAPVATGKEESKEEAAPESKEEAAPESKEEVAPEAKV